MTSRSANLTIRCGRLSHTSPQQSSLHLALHRANFGVIQLLLEEIIMAWRCTGSTNAELIQNMAKAGIITSDRVIAVGINDMQIEIDISF